MNGLHFSDGGMELFCLVSPSTGSGRFARLGLSDLM